jgi:hypothetical protein
MLDEDKRRAIALRVDDVIDQAVRVRATTIADARFCFDGTNIYCTMSSDPLRWGSVSILPGALESIEWTLATRSSLLQILRRQPSHMALQIVDALQRQLEVPPKARVHPLVCAAPKDRELLELALWEATEEHGIDLVLTSEAFRVVRSADDDYDVVAISAHHSKELVNCTSHSSRPISVNVARLEWWRSTTEGDPLFDWDDGNWNPLNAVATELLNEMTSAAPEPK